MKKRRFNLKKKSIWIITGVVVLVAAIAAASTLTGGVSAEVFQVSKGDIRQYVEDTAQVVSSGEQTVYIEGSGKVAGINVQVGDRVKKGDILLSLDKGDLELKLKDAQAKVDAAKAQLSGAEAVNYADKIGLAEAAVEQAQLSYDSAKNKYDRSIGLREAGALSEDDFKAAQNAYKSAQIALDTAKLNLEEIKNGAPSYVRTGYASQLEQANIYRDTVDASLQKQDVKTDIDGIVLEKLVEDGGVAAPGTPAFVVGSIDKLEVEADILEDDIINVKVGNEVELSGNPLGNGVIKGEVSKIAPAAKNMMSSLGVNQRRVPVTIKIDGASDLLKPGYSLEVRIITSSRSAVIQVPDTAVFDYQGQSRIFVVENGKAVLRTVKKGIESDNAIEIAEGLKEGETILAAPDNSVKEGDKIKPLKKE